VAKQVYQLASCGTASERSYGNYHITEEKNRRRNAADEPLTEAKLDSKNLLINSIP